MKLNREEGLGITLLTPTLRLPSALFYFLFTWRMKSPEGSGEPFTAHVAVGDKVKKGDLLVEVDLDKIKAAGLNSITPVLISNTDTYDKISLQKEGDVLFDEAVLKIL